MPFPVAPLPTPLAADGEPASPALFLGRFLEPLGLPLLFAACGISTILLLVCDSASVKGFVADDAASFSSTTEEACGFGCEGAVGGLVTSWSASASGSKGL